MPYKCDDTLYMMPIRDYINGIDDSFPLRNIIKAFKERYRIDNIRLANDILPFFLLLPKWIPALLNGIMVLILFDFSRKLALIERGALCAVSLLFAMLVVFLPWYDQMFECCFAFNYVWSSTLALVYLYCFVTHPRRPVNSVQSAGLIILGIVVGAFHEGISLPLFGGIAVYLLTNRNKVTRWQLLLCLSLLPGLIMLLMAPGTSFRFTVLTQYGIISILSPLKYHVPFIIFALLLIVFTLKYRRKFFRMFISTPLVIITVVSSISIVIHVVLQFAPRVGWTCILFSIIGIFYLLHELHSSFYRPKILLSSIGTLVGIAILTHLAAAAYYAVKLRDEFNNVLALYRTSEDGTVFYDIISEFDAPRLLLKKPYFETFTWSLPCSYFSNYYSKPPHKYISVVPKAMQGVPASKMHHVPGDNSLLEYNKHYVIPYQISKWGFETSLLTTFDDGSTAYHPWHFVPYCAHDSTYYTYCYPRRIAIAHMLGKKIVRIDRLQ